MVASSGRCPPVGDVPGSATALDIRCQPAEVNCRPATGTDSGSTAIRHRGAHRALTTRPAAPGLERVRSRSNSAGRSCSVVSPGAGRLGGRLANLALRSSPRAPGASQARQQWLVDGYAVVFAGLLLPAGALGDRFGRRRLLMLGMLVFGLAYGLASLSTDTGVLIACRAIAGVGAALTMPATLSIITTTFPPEERSRAVGTWAGVAGGGAVIGLLLSGTLLEFASWRWVFAASTIWAAITLVMAARWAGVA